MEHNWNRQFTPSRVWCARRPFPHFVQCWPWNWIIPPKNHCKTTLEGERQLPEQCDPIWASLIVSGQVILGNDHDTKAYPNSLKLWAEWVGEDQTNFIRVAFRNNSRLYWVHDIFGFFFFFLPLSVFSIKDLKIKENMHNNGTCHDLISLCIKEFNWSDCKLFAYVSRILWQCWIQTGRAVIQTLK